MKKNIFLITIIAGMIIAIAGWILLPTLTSIVIIPKLLPKMIAIVIPLLFVAAGAVIGVMNDEYCSTPAIILTTIGDVLMLVLIIYNKVAL